MWCWRYIDVHVDRKNCSINLANWFGYSSLESLDFKLDGNSVHASWFTQATLGHTDVFMFIAEHFRIDLKRSRNQFVYVQINVPVHVFIATLTKVDALPGITRSIAAISQCLLTRGEFLTHTSAFCYRLHSAEQQHTTPTHTNYLNIFMPTTTVAVDIAPMRACLSWMMPQVIQSNIQWRVKIIPAVRWHNWITHIIGCHAEAIYHTQHIAINEADLCTCIHAY